MLWDYTRKKKRKMDIALKENNSNLAFEMSPNPKPGG